MDFEIPEEHRMLKDLVARFVREELIPLESTLLKREAEGGGIALTREERARVDKRSRELGLWGLDAPAEIGGSDLSVSAMVGVNEAPRKRRASCRWTTSASAAWCRRRASGSTEPVRRGPRFREAFPATAMALREYEDARCSSRAIRPGTETRMRRRASRHARPSASESAP